MSYKGSRYDEFERKRREVGPREGRESHFTLIDSDGNEVPKDERKIEELVKSGKLKEQKLFRVHKADLDKFKSRR